MTEINLGFANVFQISNLLNPVHSTVGCFVYSFYHNFIGVSPSPEFPLENACVFMLKTRAKSQSAAPSPNMQSLL